MADQLATPESLASLLQMDLDASSANLVIEIATAVTQEAAGPQRLVQVVGESITLLGTAESWLDLPERPVTAVTSVSVDGVALAEGVGTGMYKRFGSRLWRDIGWAARPGTPSTVDVVYTHGYPAGHQRLELARGATLSIARAPYVGTDGKIRESIDDYTYAYEACAAEMAASPNLRRALRRQYGQRAGLVRIGG